MFVYGIYELFALEFIRLFIPYDYGFVRLSNKCARIGYVNVKLDSRRREKNAPRAVFICDTSRF